MAVGAISRRAKRDRTGRDQRRDSHAARQRQPNLVRYYRREKQPYDPSHFEFRLDLLRGRGTPPLPLADFTESFSWADEESELTGSVELRRPDPKRPESLPIERGLLIRCRLRMGERWFELWRMRCDAPRTELDSDGARVTVELRDDLNLVRRGRRKYLYRTTKKRKHGWFGHDALRDAAAKDGIRLGRIAKCKKRMDKISVEGSFLDLVKKIYENEREETGRRFVARMRNGRFEVVPFKRNRTMHVLAAQVLTSASIEQKPKVAKPVTVIAATARIGRGDKAKKVTYTHYDRRVVAKYGWVQKEKNYGRVESFNALRRKVIRELADQYRWEPRANVTTPGLPFLRRGDGAMLPLEHEGFEETKIAGVEDDRRFVWVRGIRHSVSATEYTSDVDLTADDPYIDYERKREKRKREDARKRRKRTRGDQN